MSQICRVFFFIKKSLKIRKIYFSGEDMMCVFEMLILKMKDVFILLSVDWKKMTGMYYFFTHIYY